MQKKYFGVNLTKEVNTDKGDTEAKARPILPLPLRAVWKFDLGSPYQILFLPVLLSYARVQTRDSQHPNSLSPPQPPSVYFPPWG